MKVKMVITKEIIMTGGNTFILKKDNIYEIEEIIIDSYKIKVPMKQTGKFRYALIKDEEGVLVD